jgi:predicted transposase YbfD/YdcC
LAEYLGSDWPCCRQVFRLERERRTGEKMETEAVFGITSIPRERAGAAELLALTREHWGIENGLHGRRDVTLREDASRVRRGAAPQVMAILRNLVIYLFPRSGRTSLAAAIRHYMCHPESAIREVTSKGRE